MNHLRWMLVILVALLMVVIAVQNYTALSTNVQFRLDLIFDEFKTSVMPLSLIVIIAFLIGVVSSGVYGIAERFRLKRQLKILARDIKGKDKELSSLRNLPVISEGISPDQAPESE